MPLKKLKKRLPKQSSVLSAEAKKAKEEEMVQLQRDVQKLVAEARAELQKKKMGLQMQFLKT